MTGVFATFLALLGGLRLDFLFTPLDTGLAFSGVFFLDPILGVILLEDFFRAGLAAISGVLGVVGLGVFCAEPTLGVFFAE
jgi:hypothetical protein